MPGLGHVNCYALEDRRGLALVDPGLPGPESWSALTARLADAGPLATGAHRGRHAQPPGPLRRGWAAPRRDGRRDRRAPQLLDLVGPGRPGRRRPRGPGGRAASVPTDPVGWSRVRRSMAAQGGDDGLREAARGRRDPDAHQAPGRRRRHRAGGARVGGPPHTRGTHRTTSACSTARPVSSCPATTSCPRSPRTSRA